MGIRPTDSGLLLNQLSALRAAKERGKLRIYFGYAAGVGKTYAMLSDAREVMESGADVVAGYIEPHTRPETMALMEGMEALPPLEIHYKGVALNEFDLDGALRRDPQLILVDELAHTNAQGCRHKKRYQDVEELLRAGIDVYTTLNVQHIESLNDIVATITGVTVRERIPDSVFDSADQIELVDIEPDDLIDRLHKGKIYREAQAQRALEHFFTKENLIALREIALRRTADQVNRASQTVGQDNGISGESRLYGNEQILVCVSPAPSNAKVIRSAARMADALHGVFTALFVETPAVLQEREKKQLADNLRLAEQLGAQITTVYGDDVPEQIAEYAVAGRTTRIVIGRSAHSRKWLRRANLVDRLTTLAPNMDIYIIPDIQPDRLARVPRSFKLPRLSLADTGKTAGILTACTLIGLWFEYLGFSEANIITVYILGVLVNAIVTHGYLYGVVSSILSVVLFNLFFTDPHFSLLSYDTGYPVTFLITLLAALITSTLTRRVKEQARQSAQKAYRTEVLLDTNRKLQQAGNPIDILGETAYQMVRLLNRTVIVYPEGKETLTEPLVFSVDPDVADAPDYLESDERAVAEWVYKNNKRAGASTNTLSAVKCLYLAVRGGKEARAVMGIAMDRQPPPDTFEKNLMIAMLGECGLALEKEKLDEIQKQTSLQIQQEHLRANLLRAISHDLRTPLTSISGNAGILMGNADALSGQQKKDLYADIYDDSMWLYNLVENILSITRIEDQKVKLNLQPELLEDVIGEALRHINRNSVKYHISTEVDNEFLMAKMDSQLIIQVIINIVDNAIRYTPPGSSIDISAKREGQVVCVEIADDGPGIDDGAKEKLFDMFYTVDNKHGDGRRGLGLGLSLCKSIVLAHGGEIYVRDHAPHGAVLGFTLQAEEVDMHE